MTLNGFIFGVIVLCAILWIGAHMYDDWQARKIKRARERRLR